MTEAVNERYEFFGGPADGEVVTVRVYGGDPPKIFTPRNVALYPNT